MVRTGTSSVPHEVGDYAALLTDRLMPVRGAELYAVYVHGSAVLGGWRPTVSDVDMLVVLRQEVSRICAEEIGQAVALTVPDCPGIGLELSVVSRAEAASPRAPWRFVVHVAGSTESEPKVVFPGADRLGDADLLLLNACRSLTYLDGEQLVSKTNGGQWALDRGLGPRNGIRHALGAQAGAEPGAALTGPDREFIECVARRLAAAAEDGR